MTGFFSAEDVARLEQGSQDVQKQYRELQERFLTRTYRSALAREYAHHGFSRRLDTLARSIKFVFEILPPGREDIPELDDVVAATICIQAFVFNAFGCLDNLAWIWVHESGLKDADGRELKPERVGLGARYSYVRRSFSPEFSAYLKGRKKWFKHLTGFRDSLAHRIPLYIPPYIISSDDAQKYKELEQQLHAAITRTDGEYERIRAEQKKLGHFRPWMTHSPFEGAPTAVFHWQLLQDYATVDEFGRKMLEELDRLEKRPATDGDGWSLSFTALICSVRVWLAIAAAVTALAVLYRLFHR